MEEQGKLDIQAEKKLNTIEEYKFEPIKGYPMLHWKGKRPFNSTQYYPAQLKESYGEEVNGWMNKIFWGDNLQVMSHLLKEYRGKIDLIYIDPPYDSKADYKKTIKLKGGAVKTNHNNFEEKQYTDIWSNDDYLQFMYERLVIMRELLSDKGSIYLHCDVHKNHFLKCIMNEVFGPDNFRNEIVWCYFGFKRKTSKKFPQKQDTIYSYTKSMDYTWHTQFRPHSNEYISRFKTDENGRKYRDDVNPTGGGARIIYLDEIEGDIIESYWTDIPPVNPVAKERMNYPTQKPERLIERIINSSTNPGDIVFDCFMGAGTTQAVALKTGRKFIGADINLGAIETTIKRLNKNTSDISSNTPKIEFKDEDGELQHVKDFYTGFSVYNVNNYDVFRNPIQAKEILKQALEIQPLPSNTIYDGEKDGRMVKIMPVNRIATRADLNELISGFNYKSFEKKSEKSPNKSVESLLLVCMGHEPDLAASLQKEVPYKLDVEVVDILRDKAKLEFKRDSEAEVIIEEDKLIVKQFYPMNLLQKLSLMKENVEDWKELTETVKIDFNYDGSVFEPTIVDVPEKNEMVVGEYEIPEDAGTIRIKITDLLSESLELTIDNN
ncbi:site-specific DNA-methyltransferase [Tenacibaculum maritimum]|nr:site-specific DNA-methyltransferase [Tenacibaculum maritimum]MDB0601774.1 site-specific DNA-methyltransferase [Tenacibaculum maritimum]MDB0610856.1 site-specific DNA-methyltransferase [Tenacibaculum maritimum]